jgi:hypothetical protein
MSPSNELQESTQRDSTPESKSAVYLSPFFLLGSYIIALLLSGAIHELGHGLAMALVSVDFRLVLNPFGMSMAQPLAPIPQDSFLFVVASGMIIEVAVGTIVFLSLWRWRRPMLVPILLLGPLSYLSVSGYLLAGTIVPGSDLALMISAGIPYPLLQIIGILLMVFGAFAFLLLFPLLGISTETTLLRIFMILLVGLTVHGFGMILFALITNPSELYVGVANVISMFITVSVLSVVYTRYKMSIDRRIHTDVAEPSPRIVYATLAFALGFIIFELLFFN